MVPLNLPWPPAPNPLILDQAFAWLEKDFHDRNGGLTLLKVVPYYGPLRADARFTDLVRRIGLPPENGVQVGATLRNR